MGQKNSLIDLGSLSKPATVLIEKISDAVGGIFKPQQIRRVAGAEADAEVIKATAAIEVTELQQRAFRRMLMEEEQRQRNIESITKLAGSDKGLSTAGVFYRARAIPPSDWPERLASGTRIRVSRT